jgi:MFS family permease
VLGAFASTRRKSVRLRSIALLTGTYGLAIVVGGLVPLYGVFLAGIVALGLSRILFATAAESMVQLSTRPSIRGRVMAIYIVVLVGGQAAGGLIIGAIAEAFGIHAAFAVAGGMPLLAAIVVASILARRHQLTIKVNLRDFRKVVRIVKRPKAQRSASSPSQRPDSSTSSAP